LAACSIAACRPYSEQLSKTYDLAKWNKERGEYIVALQEVRSVLQQRGDSQSDWFWRFRSLEAEILMLQGHYKQSLDLLNFALPERLRGSEVEAQQRMTQAAASAFLFQTDSAHKYFNDAAQIIRTTQPRLLGDLTILEGTLAFLAGDSLQAYSKYLAARDIARQNKDQFLEAASLGSLGLAATGLERYDESVDWNKQARQLSLSIGAKNSLGKIEGNIGWSYHELGDLDNALHQFELAEKAAAKADNISDQSYWLNSQASVYYDLHDYGEADSISRKALKLARDLNDVRTLIECLQTQALIAIARSEAAEAQSDIDEAFRLQSAAPDPKRDLYTALLAAHLMAKTRNLQKIETSYMQIVRDRRASTSLRWEALASLAQVHAAQGKIAAARREFAQSIDTISKAQDSIKSEDSRLSFLTASINFYDQYVNFFLAQNEPIKALAVADRSRAQTLEHGLSLDSKSITEKSSANFFTNPQEIARKQNATLLFYWLGQDRSHLWVVTPNRTSLLPLPPSPEIGKAAESYRESFDGPLDPLESANANGIKLYDILIRPAEKLIPPNSRVVILPDGPLNGLNFETLIVSSPQRHYWIEDATISVANSLSLLARAGNSPAPRPGNLLFFGSPISPSNEFPTLADAEKETEAVKKHFSQADRKLFLGNDARASAYVSSDPERYSYLHFATHGVASLTRPLESAIILTREGDSYKLYARDIVQHPLNAYLVSISACNGTGTKNFAGEGLIGLSWAFLRAGAHHVVAGLWEVSTASSPQIMDDLYRGVTSGQDPATALRNAKLSLLHSGGIYKKPFYWAPFQLYSGS
jgi:CHAT domain-containing protein